ncbi:SAM-dependent methyltransferase [Longimycelium tulufanense]|uniref:SAM-dependent methyltransferase n=1 Tax=Longimycelium tulufanense TaxID=907463 RepID=UPI001664FF54|nr:SAM-dependent methyltransferase [Longimycelium tulufanense]
MGVDPTRASIARVYDAFLGGKDNYEIDRQVFQSVQKVAPEAQELALENRGFLIRACRFLAGQAGISQFLDCGSGLPTAENIHQVVQRINPDARVVYIDNDPVVLAHGRALLEENDRTHFVSADIFHPEEILENQEIRQYLDFSEPLAFLQLGTLHHYDGPRERPARIMREYVDALPSGSYIAISHFLDPENEHSELARRMEHVFLHSPMGSGTFRTRAELLELFCGLELVDPGLTFCAEWWPDGPRTRPLSPVQQSIAGGVARKP